MNEIDIRTVDGRLVPLSEANAEELRWAYMCVLSALERWQSDHAEQQVKLDAFSAAAKQTVDVWRHFGNG